MFYPFYPCARLRKSNSALGSDWSLGSEDFVAGMHCLSSIRSCARTKWLGGDKKWHLTLEINMRPKTFYLILSESPNLQNVQSRHSQSFIAMRASRASRYARAILQCPITACSAICMCTGCSVSLIVSWDPAFMGSVDVMQMWIVSKTSPLKNVRILQTQQVCVLHRRNK